MGSANSNERFETAKAMLNYGFSNYELINLEIDEEAFNMVEILGGESDGVKPYVKENTKLLIKKGEAEKIEQTVTLAKDVEAPVAENQKLGSVAFTLDGKTLLEVPLLASEEVKKLTFYTSLKRIMNFLACGEKI